MSEKQYTSPLVSCICCREVKSAKGIFSHFFANHDSEGILKMTEIRQKGTAATFNNPEFQIKYQKPKKSKSTHKCHNPDCVEFTTNNKYCSRQCGAIVNNQHRSGESRTKFKSIKAPKPTNSRTCVCCNRVETTKGRFQSDKCSFCNDSLTYRGQCEFKFNLKDYPSEFDFRLLNEHGMFSPRNNPKGVSRDHMLSVRYGKDNKIDPKIISHPANCRLMLQGDNTRKQSESSITLNELMIRIAEWDSKYPSK